MVVCRDALVTKCFIILVRMQLLIQFYEKFFFCFFNSVLRPFQDYFSSYETGQSVGGQKRENPREKKHLAHPQAELGLSHMWPVRGSNPMKSLLI